MYIVIFFNLVLYGLVYVCSEDASVETIYYNEEDIFFLEVELKTSRDYFYDFGINKNCENVSEPMEWRIDKSFNYTEILKFNKDCTYYFKYNVIFRNRTNSESKTIVKIKQHTDNPIIRMTYDVKYTVVLYPFQANTAVRYLEGDFDKTSSNTYIATRYVGQNFAVTCDGDDRFIYKNNERVTYILENSNYLSYKLKVQKFDDNAEMQCGAGSNRQIYKLRVLSDGRSIGYDTSIEEIFDDDTQNNLIYRSTTEKQYVSWILVDANDVVIDNDHNKYRTIDIQKLTRDKPDWSKLVCLQTNCEHKNIGNNGAAKNVTQCQREVIKVYKKSTKPILVNTERTTEKPAYTEEPNTDTIYTNDNSETHKDTNIEGNHKTKDTNFKGESKTTKDTNTKGNSKITKDTNTKGNSKTTKDTNTQGNSNTTKDTNTKGNSKISKDTNTKDKSKTKKHTNTKGKSKTTKDTNTKDDPKNIDHSMTTEDRLTKTNQNFNETDISASSHSGSENQSFIGPPIIGTIVGVTGVAISIFIGIYCKWKGKRRKEDNENNNTEETIYASTDRIQYLELNLESSANIPPPKREEVEYSKIAGVLLARST